MKKHLDLIFRKYYGHKEVYGKESNPVILKIIKEIYPPAVDDSTIAWCSIFVSYILNQFGYNFKILAARKWLKQGYEPKEPEIGDLVIFSRGNQSWQGHVGFYIRETDDYIYVLSGNQSNAINISPYRKNKVLGYRRICL